MTDLEVLDRASLVSIEAMIITTLLLCTASVNHMSSSRIPRQLRYGVLAQGHRNLGRPKKRYKACVKKNLKYAGLAEAQLGSRAQDRPGWRAATNRALKKFEVCRQEKISFTRQRLCMCASISLLPVSHCPTMCASRVGLTSHSRTHQRRLH